MQTVLELYLAAPHEPLNLVVPARFGDIGVAVSRVDCVLGRCVCRECVYALRLECPSENIDWTACGTVVYGFRGGALTEYRTDYTRMDAATFCFSHAAMQLIANPDLRVRDREVSRAALRHTS